MNKPKYVEETVTIYGCDHCHYFNDYGANWIACNYAKDGVVLPSNEDVQKSLEDSTFPDNCPLIGRAKK